MARRRRKFKVSATLAVLGVTFVPEKGQGFDRKDAIGWACAGLNFPVLRWQFVNGAATWTADEQVLVRDAIARWDLFRNSNNGAILTSIEDNSSTGVVKVVRNLADGTSSNAACPNGVPELRIHSTAATLSNPGTIVSSSSHEAGHGHGLDHAGDDDSLMFGGSVQTRVPQMSGCNQSSNATSGYPESDDFAQAVAKGNSPNLPTGVYNPDGGFETYGVANTLGVGDPRRAPLQTWSGMKSLVTNGTNDYASIGTTGGSTPQLQQIVRMATPPSGFAMRTRYKMASSSTGGNFKLRYRRLTYSAGAPSCGNAWPSTFNVNQPSFVNGNWVIASANSVFGTTSWTDSPQWLAPAQANEPLGNGVDVQLLATNLNPENGDLYVDNFFGLMA